MNRRQRREVRVDHLLLVQSQPPKQNGQREHGRCRQPLDQARETSARRDTPIRREHDSIAQFGRRTDWPISLQEIFEFVHNVRSFSIAYRYRLATVLIDSSI